MDSTFTLRTFRNRPTVLASALALATAMFVVLLAGHASAGITVNKVVAGSWDVEGDTTPDTITLTCSGGNVKANGADPTTGVAACSSITEILVFAHDGDDTVDLTGVSVAAGFNASLGGHIDAEGQFGNDTLNGGPLKEELNGGDGDDTVNGGLGDDLLEGGTNTAVGDIVTYASASGAEIVNLTAGTATGAAGSDSVVGFENVIGSAFNDTITGDGGVNVLKGGDGNDTLKGGDGNDTENGENGDDTFDEGAAANGADVLNGGAGTDLADYSARTAVVTVTLDTLANDGEATEGDNVGADGLVENVNTGSGNDSITGNGLANTFNGGGGDDTESGGDGNDTFAEGASPNGKDVLSGDAGTDTADYSKRTGNVNVTLDAAANDGEQNEGDNVGGTGNTVENVTTGSGDDTLAGNSGPNALTGGAGNDTADYSAVTTAGVNANLATGIATGAATGTDTLAGIENLKGTALNDVLIGSDAVNVLTGNAGNDTLNGGLGGDILNGSDGVDTASYAGRVNAVSVTLDGIANDGESGENDNVQTDVENVTGGVANDLLVGDTQVNGLKGGPGNDILRGLGGADVAIGGLGDDVLKGGTENDTLRGGGGNDTALGGSGDDVLRGGAGNDTLKGGPGNDTMFGGPGNDTCLQGSGSGALHSC